MEYIDTLTYPNWFTLNTIDVAHSHCAVYWYEIFSDIGGTTLLVDPIITNTNSALKDIIIDTTSAFSLKVFYLEAKTFGFQSAY